MKKHNVIVWGLCGIGVVLLGVSSVVSSETQRQIMQAGPEAQITIWATLLKLLPQFGGWGSIVAAVLTFLRGQKVVTDNVTDTTEQARAVDESSDIVELVRAVIAWAKKPDDTQRIVHVILAVVDLIRSRFANNPEIVQAAGNLVSAVSTEFYVKLPVIEESTPHVSGNVVVSQKGR